MSTTPVSLIHARLPRSLIEIKISFIAGSSREAFNSIALSSMVVMWTGVREVPTPLARIETSLLLAIQVF